MQVKMKKGSSSMLFAFTLMNTDAANVILAWRYEPPYTIYTMGGEKPEERADSVAEMLDRLSPYYAVHDGRGELIGFFCFGTASLMWDSDQPGIYVDTKTVPIGLGMRPDLTGKGLGQRFVEAGLAFAKQTFAPEHFVLYVYLWNERAIKVYERIGFQPGEIFVQKNRLGESKFVEMRMDV
jgi:[ribosomal protein S18]-alanine N-acetyltransferase